MESSRTGSRGRGYKHSVAVTLILLALPTIVKAFSSSPSARRGLVHANNVMKFRQEHPESKLFQKSDDASEETVPLGSEEYYQGFVSRSLQEEPQERVTGDAVLGPTFKFVGGFAVVLIALFVGFLASNGLL